MAVMAREAWTDERLGDLNKKVNDGFGEMRTEFRAVRIDMREELGAMRKDMGAVQAEIGALNRTIHQFMFAMVGTVFLGFTGTIAALITLA